MSVLTQCSPVEEECVHCWLALLSVGRQLAPNQHTAQTYWQVSRTDGHSVGECEWLLVKGLADWGLHQPINQTCLATSAKAFIMNPRGQDGSQCVCLCPGNGLDLTVRTGTVKDTPHISGSISSHQYLTIELSDPPSRCGQLEQSNLRPGTD